MRLLKPASVEFAPSVTNPSVSVLQFGISFLSKGTSKMVNRELKFLSVKNWVVFEKIIKKIHLRLMIWPPLKITLSLNY